MKPFATVGTVGGLGEKRLISRVCAKFGAAADLPPPFGAGDDCALVLSQSLKKNVLLTSDAVILGRHFSPDTPPELAGAKLVKRNVSDIAAMGAHPFAALASSICSPNVSVEWLDGFCGGMGVAAEKYGLKIIGGDFASVGGDFFSTHLTLLGQTDGRTLLRVGASAGDYICVSGALGASFESGHHLAFEPRVEQGVFLAAEPRVSACTDLSDGAASDLRNLLPRGTCAELSESAVPRREYCGKTATLKQALCDGEDYELLFTFSGAASELSAFSRVYEARFGEPFYVMGQIKTANPADGEDAVFVVSQNRREPFSAGGFDHYQP